MQAHSTRRYAASNRVVSWRIMQQELRLIEEPKKKERVSSVAEWGTFRDSLKAPVHGWFTYPAGFSYKAVEHSLREASLKIGHDTIYDPFMGSGTTNIVARSMGFNSVGVEAHPFVYEITKTKMNWDLNFSELNSALVFINKRLVTAKQPDDLQTFLNQAFPELIIKCFLPETLFELMMIRDSLLELNSPKEIKDFLRTALICVLRDVSIAATGWPYIAPKKIKITSLSKKGWITFYNRTLKMFGDLMSIRNGACAVKTTHLILCGDCRDTTQTIASESANYTITSPPYLNNFDYADRTRLEMYFMGDAKNWGEISDKIRSKLMTSATTQISRNDPRYEFLPEFKKQCPEVYEFLDDVVRQLSELRNTKGGKKSYDLLTIGYFNDIYRVLKDNFRILRDGSKALYILGDSAPYGVHIPTDELIGKIGVAVGFKKYRIQVLRARGDKWKNNPQRHNVTLKESVVVLNR